MKILMLLQQQFPNREDGKIAGGIQMCETKQIEILRKHHEVHVYQCADAFPYADCVNHFSQIPSRGYSKERIDYRVRRQEIEALIANNDYDAIVVHDWSTTVHNLMLKVTTDAAVIVYQHVTPTNLGGISAYAKLEGVYQQYLRGNLVLWVSASCAAQWRMFIGKTISKYPHHFSNPEDFLGELDDVVSAHLHSFNVMDYDVFPVSDSPDGTTVMVTRIDADKDHKKCFDLAKNNGLDLKLVTPMIETDHQKKIADLYRSMFNREILVGLPREQVLEEMSKADAMICSFQESLGIAACEAAMCGIPVVAFSHETVHGAAYEANGLPTSIQVFSAKDKIEVPKTPYEERLKNAAFTRARYGEKSFLESFHTMVDVAKELRTQMSQPSEESSLEDFFS